MSKKENLMENLISQENEFLLEQLHAKPGDIKTREDLKKYSFHCPWCNKTKPATEMVILKVPMELNQNDLGDNVEVTVTQKIGVCCRDCACMDYEKCRRCWRYWIVNESLLVRKQ